MSRRTRNIAIAAAIIVIAIIGGYFALVSIGRTFHEGDGDSQERTSTIPSQQEQTEQADGISGERTDDTVVKTENIPTDVVSVGEEERAQAQFTDESGDNRADGILRTWGAEHAYDSQSVVPTEQDMRTGNSISTSAMRDIEGEELYDMELAADTASEFVTAFFTFNSSTLSNGKWRSSVADMIDVSMASSEPSSSLINRRFIDNAWATNTGTYPAFKSTVISTEVQYATTTRHGDKQVPFVNVRTTVDRCADEPGGYTWDQIEEHQTDYLVTFTPDGKVFKIETAQDNLIKLISYGSVREPSYD